MRRLLALFAVLALTTGFTVTKSELGVNRIVYRTFCPSGCTTAVGGNGTTTYVPTPGLIAAIVECVGGGGGTGGAANGAGASGSGGGGAGGYSRVALSAAQIGASKAITIGALGLGSPTAGGDGSPGGASSFGVTLCSAPGGGASLAAPTLAQSPGGDASGVGTGDLVISGGGGDGGKSANTAIFHVRGATGAPAPLGFGMPKKQGLVAPDATGNGSGGTGAATWNSGGGNNGGDGSPGIVIVTEFIGGGGGYPKLDATPICQGTSNINDAVVSCVSTVAVAAGETIVVLYGTNTNLTVSTISDGTANVYISAGQSSGSNSAGGRYVFNPVPVPSGSTFTLTLTGLSFQKAIQVYKLNGVATAIVNGADAAGAAPATCVTTNFGASVPVGSAVFGSVVGGNSTAIVASSAVPWISPADQNVVVGAARGFIMQHGQQAGSGPVTYAPTIGAAGWGCFVIGLVP